MIWFEISRMVALGLPSLVIEDFNCIMGPHKKMGGKQYTNNIDSKSSGGSLVTWAQLILVTLGQDSLDAIINLG